jgi:hypothetical protein
LTSKLSLKQLSKGLKALLVYARLHKTFHNIFISKILQHLFPLALSVINVVLLLLFALEENISAAEHLIHISPRPQEAPTEYKSREI